MSKNSIFLIIGVVVIVGLVGFFLFKGKQPKGEYKIPELKEVPKEEKEEVKDYFFKIEGIGFKPGAWAKYKYEGGDKSQEFLVKILSFKIGENEFLGIEEESSLLGIGAMLFEKEGENLAYFLQKIPKMGTLCFKEKPTIFSGGGPSYIEQYKKENLEKEYKVDKTEWEFVGKEKMKLESGKEIEVFKFKKEGAVEPGKKMKWELVLSGQVPTYFVFSSEVVIENGKEIQGPTVKLVDFGLEGATSAFTENDLKSCEKPGEIPALPEIPTIPLELQKYLPH